MQIREKKYNYLDEKSVFSYKESLWNWVKISAYVVFDTEKFQDYQKELLQDFLADFKDKSDTEVYDEWDLRVNLESWLEKLNENLKTFAEKVSDVDRFNIKWYVHIIAWDTLMSSLIWDTSIMIFRNGTDFYKSYNSPNKKSKIDTFSGFTEWNVESGDEIIYLWTKVQDLLDQSDMSWISDVLNENEDWFIEYFVDLITSRANRETIWFLTNYYIHWNVNWEWSTWSMIAQKLRNKMWWLRWKWVKLNTEWTKKVFANKYYVIIFVLSIVILFMLYWVLSQLLKTWENNTFVTDSWTVIDITIDDIKKDIFAFQQMDASSDEKWVKYNEIIEKLDILESKGRWVEDVQSLKWIVEDNYYEWFNIDRISDLSSFDDPATWIKSRILAFNNTEKWKLWDLLSIDYQNSLNIGWTEWALIWASNDTSRWTLMEYWVEADIAWCNINLLKDWLFCYTKDGRIFNITKAWVNPLITADETWFPDTVLWVGTYNKSSLYVFQPNLTSSLNWVFVTRYKNIVWSETSYQAWQNYSVVDWWVSGLNVWNFSSVAIDSTFLTWSNWALYQLWRPSAYGTNLEIRQIKLLWWDTINNKYSNNIKVIAQSNSKYVYLFDRDNSTFTVYTSNPLKTNDSFNTQFNLYYLFSFKFVLTSEKVIDIAIPDTTWNKPDMYILTDQWVNKVSLNEYISSVEKDDILKATN